MTYNKMYIRNDYIVGALLGVHKASKILKNLMSVYEISSYSDNFSFVWYIYIPILVKKSAGTCTEVLVAQI